MNTIVKVSKSELVAKVKEAKASGLFFSTEGIKRTTGELRYFKSLLGGVKKHTNGVGLAFNPDKKDLLVVWESINDEGYTGKFAYRMIALEGLKAVIFKGIRYELVE